MIQENTDAFISFKIEFQISIYLLLLFPFVCWIFPRKDFLYMQWINLYWPDSLKYRWFYFIHLCIICSKLNNTIHPKFLYNKIDLFVFVCINLWLMSMKLIYIFSPIIILPSCFQWKCKFLHFICDFIDLCILTFCK